MGSPTVAPPFLHQLITPKPKLPSCSRRDWWARLFPSGFASGEKQKQKTCSCISVLQGAVEWVGTEPSCRREVCFWHDTLLRRRGLHAVRPYADLPFTNHADTVAEGDSRSYCLCLLFPALLPHFRITSIIPKLQIPAPRNERQRLGQPPPAHAPARHVPL